MNISYLETVMSQSLLSMKEEMMATQNLATYLFEIVLQFGRLSCVLYLLPECLAQNVQNLLFFFSTVMKW